LEISVSPSKKREPRKLIKSNFKYYKKGCFPSESQKNMKLVMMRHSEPDYSAVNQRGFPGIAKNFGALTERGIAIAEEASKDERLKGAELIISSPYTRALQTAAIVSKNTGLSIAVENDLHEWMNDISMVNNIPNYTKYSAAEYNAQKGKKGPDSLYNWEEAESVANRAYAALKKYLKYNYEKVIVVSHGIVMRQFTDHTAIPFCGIVEVDFDESFHYTGFCAPHTSEISY